MKVLLLKDVYNLGRAGDVKKVADGYGRNYLLPRQMAVLATPGALKHVDKIRETATKVRELLNAEKAGLAAQLADLHLEFTAKAGESGKLFGSITQQMVVDAIKEKIQVEIDRHHVESQPLRELGEHKVRIRLTFDLVPQVIINVKPEEEEKKETGKVRGKAAPRKPRREVKTEPAAGKEESKPEAPPAAEEKAEPETPPAEEKAESKPPSKAKKKAAPEAKPEKASPKKKK
jgi:large subunit ribosomal protein L9